MANNQKVNNVAERINRVIDEWEESHRHFFGDVWRERLAAELAKEEAGAAPEKEQCRCGHTRRNHSSVSIHHCHVCECEAFQHPDPAAQSPEAEEWIEAAARQINQEIDDWFDGHRFALVRDGEQWRQSDDREIGGIIKRHYTASQRGKRSVEAWAAYAPDDTLIYYIFKEHERTKQAVEDDGYSDFQIIPVTITYTPEKQ